MKRICIIGPSIKMGGIERASCNFANSLDDLGYEVIFIAIFNQSRFFKLNGDIEYLEPPNFNKNALDFFKTVFWLRATIKKVHPDSIFILNKFYSAITLFSIAFLNYRTFISERSSPFFVWDKKIDFFNKTIFKLWPPTGVVAQTNIAMKYQKRYHRKSTKFKVIPNPVRDIKLYDIKRKNYILAVGRFNDINKGFDLLVEAFSKIDIPNWKLVFAGGDEDGQYLKEQAENLGILDNVIFLGKVENIDRLFCESKIFVIPSRSEGFPNALCEAMAAGLPCISFDFVAGPSDIIDHDYNGLIVENGNINEMAKSISYLIENEGKRAFLGNNAIQIREKLHIYKIGKKLSEFILS